MSEENPRAVPQRSSTHNIQTQDEEAAALKIGSPGTDAKRSNPERKYKSGQNENGKPVYEDDDDDKRPPNVEKCKIHQSAKRVYASLMGSEKSQVRKICDCCGNAYDLRRLNMCCPKSDLYHLGAGYPLYFEFVVFCAALIFIMMACSGIYNVYTNIDNHDCANNESLERHNVQFCDLNWITRTSLVNKRSSETELEISNWINLGTVIIMIISFHFFRRQTSLTTQEVDNSQQTPGDYTIMIKNLPLDAKDEEIKNFFEQEVFFERKVQIVKIIRGFDIGQFVKLQRRKNDIQLELGKENVKNRQKLEKELEDIKRNIDVMENNANQELDPSPFAFITFEQESDAREALSRLSFSPTIKKLFFRLGCYSCFSDFKFRGEIKLNAQRAPEPSDIIWENLGTSKTEKIKRRTISLIVSIILILVCGGIIIAINVGKSRLSNPEDVEHTNVQATRSFGTEVISVVIGLVINIINSSLNYSTRIFAAYENRSTYTSYFVSVARALALSTFVNTSIVLLVTNYILNTLWKNGGLLNDVVVVYVINVAVGPLMSLFNPWYFWRLYQRRRIINQGENCPLTQKEANQVFEGPEIDMAQMYATVVNTLWTTAFFAPILPISIPIPLINLFLTFWADKYLLLNRYAKPTELSKGLSLWMTEFLEVTPFVFAAGNIIFRHLITSDDLRDIDATVLPSILSLAISFAFFVLPIGSLSKSCFQGDDLEGCKKTGYSEMRVQFNNDYDIANPVYHDDALESWLKAVEQAGQQQNEELLQIVKNEINQGKNTKTDELGKNYRLVNNIKAYANRVKGLEKRNDKPSAPNQAMVFLNVGHTAAKQANFILHPYLHAPQYTNPYGNAPTSQFNISIAASNRPGHTQLNFESGFNPNQPQYSNFQPNQPIQQPSYPQYIPQNRPPQYPPQYQGLNTRPNFVPQYPMNPSNQQFVPPPYAQQQNLYPQGQPYPPQHVQMVQMNNGPPMSQPGYARHFPQN